ncbi:50S ribosomal protein L4 [Orientia chuto str. Dubai]|uniref:Large ribosomal subunit protein uL4 n=1 Tax=Orientia chuto str. Dubai TaxID=1359168 RepID=A0A0F3MHP1_9RICK|nr:50S ribosomal protein L4 [Candidatus Orientia mediorientalis]KJV55283.1 50S ribosomal protein L4 [Orientia chuto str. Dubai]
MKVKIYNFLQQKAEKEIDLNPNVFCLKYRPDIVKLVIGWQLAKRMSGTHSTKTISGVSGTTKKPFRQKGTGSARQGSLRSVQMRGGGVSHGPVVRSHEFNIPKKIRKQALKYALSYKLSTDKLMVVNDFNIGSSKTAILSGLLKKYCYSSFFCIDDHNIDKNFFLASRNLFNLNVVAQIGANPYDIIKHDCVMITLEAIKSLEMRLVG